MQLAPHMLTLTLDYIEGMQDGQDARWHRLGTYVHQLPF